ncbi:ParB/RepB/Spo0J family partition protein [Desulfonatronum parangueonense]
MAGCIRVYATDLDSSGAALFWARPAVEELSSSLGEVGQLDPVLVRPGGDGYRLLSGYQRTDALSRMGKPISAHCLDGPDDPVGEGMLYLHANLHRALDDGMRIMALRYFQPWLTPDDMGRQIASLLRLQPRSGAWQRHLAWLRLPRVWDAHLLAGNIPLAAGQILEHLSPADLDALEPCFRTLKWSQGRAVQWLTFLREISLREKWTVEQILENTSSVRTLEAGLSPQDTLQRLVSQARRLRYPNLSEIEGQFEAVTRELLGSSRWTLTPSPDFESDQVELRLQARSPREIQTAAQALQKAAASDALPRLFRLTRQG